AAAPAASAPEKPAKKAAKQSAPEPVPLAYRVAVGYEDYENASAKFSDRLAAFLDDPAATAVPALVIGSLGVDDGLQSGDSGDVVEALVAARDRLPNLRALFIGDITYEEQELSWIRQSDLSPLFAAFPKLEHFRARGGEGLSLGKVRHKNLRSLVLETG